MHKATRVSTAAIIITIGGLLILTGCGKSKAKRENEKAIAEMNADLDQMNARMKKEAQDQARWQKEAEAKEAARIAAAEKKREDEERKEQEERRLAEEKERRDKAEKEKELAAYADKRFAEVSMEPKVLLSPRAKAMNFTFTFIGKDLQTYKKHLADRNWHGIMKLLDPYHKDEFEYKGSIDSAVRDLKKKQFQFLARINPAAVPKDKFCYLPIPSVDDPDANWYGAQGVHETVWEKHPDGNAVMHWWIPADREIMILVSDNPYSWEKGNVNQARRELDTQFREGVEKLERKKELGEIDDAGFSAQLRQLKEQKRNAYLALLNRF